jgi:hypothetical protein
MITWERLVDSRFPTTFRPIRVSKADMARNYEVRVGVDVVAGLQTTVLARDEDR